MTTDRDALDLETMLRQHYRWGEQIQRVGEPHVGPRRYRIAFKLHDEERASLHINGATKQLRVWQETGVCS